MQSDRDDRFSAATGGLGDRVAGFPVRAILLLACLVPALPAIAAPNNDETLYLKEREFRIPIQVDAANAAQIKELRLFVSTDRGRGWKQLRTAKPTEKAFTFQAQADGDYWFALASVDKQGRMDPPSVAQMSADVKVVIDTTSPRIVLEAAPTGGGKARIAWQIDDQHADAGSLQILVRSAPDKSWRAIAVSKAAEGETLVPVAPGDGLEVRASVRDRAGNESTSQASIARLVEGRTSASLAEAAAADIVPQPVLPPPMAAPPAYAEQDRSPRMHGLDQRSVESDAAYIPVRRQWSQEPGRGETVHEVRRPFADRAATEPLMPRQVVGTDPRLERTNGARPAHSANRIPVATTRESITPAAATAPAPALPAPTTVTIPLVPSRSFALNYQLRGVGPAGVRSVELYITKDNGQTWELYGEDPDRMPPFQVTVPADGRYGLSIVVTNQAGWRQPPAQGDRPKLVVEVDTAAPEAEMYEPIPDTNGGNVLVISWSAKDLHLSERPVSLYFAERRDGERRLIQSGLPAAGEYRWSVPTGVPHKVHLILVTEDQGGNTSVAATPEPIVVDFSRPDAVITTEDIAILPGGSVVR